MLSPQTQVSLLRIVACGRVLRGRACGPLPVTTPLPQLFPLVVATPILASSPGGSCRQHRERRPSLPRHCTDNATPRPGRRCEQQGNHHMRSLHMFQTRLQFCLARTKASAKGRILFALVVATPILASSLSGSCRQPSRALTSQILSCDGHGASSPGYNSFHIIENICDDFLWKLFLLRN